MDDFRCLLRDLVTEYGGTKRDLALACGITPSQLSHLLAAKKPPRPEVCLRLALATHTSASKILRAAGRGDIADILEDLYGEAAQRRHTFNGIRPTPLEQHHLVSLRALDGKTHRAICLLVEAAKRQADAPAKALPFPRDVVLP